MKASKIIGVIGLIGIFVMFYQYYFSMCIQFVLKSVFDKGDSAKENPVYSQKDVSSCVRISNLNEEMIRSAVRRVQEMLRLSPVFAASLIQELITKNSAFGHDPTGSVTSKMELASQQPLGSSSETSRIPVSSQNLPNTASSIQMSSRNVPYTAWSVQVSAETEQLRKSVPLYIITATYPRPEQMAMLIRVCQTLMLVENIHWLVIEDAEDPTVRVTKLLKRSGLKFEHLIAPMPDVYKNQTSKEPRGVSNRNRGLEWIRANATHGVFYFADEDNTYDLPLFDEIRRTKRVSMFPVGLTTSFGLISPVLRDGKFAGFYDGWVAGRKFPMDMAGFAVNVEFLLQRPNAMIPYVTEYQQDGFLRSLAPLEPSELEFLAANCTKIYVWHDEFTNNLNSTPLDMETHGDTNLVKLKKLISIAT
ncbi:galactosylgalactosylxylosylprotein 3-beta-glucuronosyltransferase P-like isoform X2 [Lasioglossum baleicum]